ncbi:hypothetical protein D3C71_2134140 [compost metagenome]
MVVVKASKGSCIGPVARYSTGEPRAGTGSVGRLSMSHSERERSTLAPAWARQYHPA